MTKVTWDEAAHAAWRRPQRAVTLTLTVVLLAVVIFLIAVRSPWYAVIGVAAADLLSFYVIGSRAARGKPM